MPKALRKRAEYKNDGFRRLTIVSKELDGEMRVKKLTRMVTLEIKCLMCGRVGRTVSIPRVDGRSIILPVATGRCTTCGGNLNVVDE